MKRVLQLLLVSAAVLSTTSLARSQTQQPLVFTDVPGIRPAPATPQQAAKPDGVGLNQDGATPRAGTNDATNLFSPAPAAPPPPQLIKAGDYDAAYSAYIAGHYKTAFDLAMRRAEIGDSYAMTLIGVLYLEGRAVIQDSERAAYWFARGAEAGDAQAALRYGINLFNGISVPKDETRGEELIKQAADAGIPAAYSYYAQILMNNAARDDRLDIGLTWFLKGAVAGDPYSAYSASEILGEGTPKVPKNEPAARALLEAAAISGNVAAQMDLAKWMIEGRGGPKDDEGAFNLMKIVSVNGIPPAQVNLARLYREGIGTEPDKIMAAAWYMIAKQANFNAPDLDDMLNSLKEAELKKAQARVATLLISP